MSTTELNPDLEKLLEYIKRNRGFDFSGYKRTSLSRRIRKRMHSVGIESYSDYLDYLEVHPDEFVELFNTILINVTTFFRDPEAWEYIATEIIPQILASKQVSTPVRVWSAGCASGEETYTIAMLLVEALGIEEYTARVKVFATDVDMDALNYARQGNYNSKEVQSVPPQLLDKYFERVNGRYVVQKELRRGVIFGRHDLLQDAAILRIDLLMCRNAIMYFNRETQAKILARFHFALNNNGFLFLGKAEMLFSRNHSYTAVDLRQRVFTKLGNSSMRDLLLNMTRSNSQQVMPEIVDKLQIYEAGFEVDSVAQIVVDSNSILILANAEARKLFNLNLKDIDRPLQDLELSYRPIDLQSPIDQVHSNRRAITFKDVEWSIAEFGSRYFDVQITPLLDENTDELLAIKIIFTDVTRIKQLQQDLVHANQELETAYEELQSTNEELETTNEELQSTVEELETTNEELQSTNEELETMNEELQSTNEELQTMNEELRQRSEELNKVNSFLESILISVRVGVVVLNPELQILIWNRKAEDMWGLRFDEVFSKQLISLDIGLPIEPLIQPLRTIITGQLDYHEVLLKARNRRGKSIGCQVICTGLRSSGLDVEGVVLLVEEHDQEQ